MVEFSKVIAVRERKRERATKGLTQAEAARDEACDAVQLAQSELETFAESVKTLEVELLRDLLRTNITVSDVAILRDKLKKAEEKAREHVANVQRARDALMLQENAVEAQRHTMKVTSSKLRRITEIDKELARIESTKAILREDAKLDEFAEQMAARGHRLA